MRNRNANAFGKTGLTVPSIIYGTSFLGNLYHELPAETKLQIMQKWFEVSASTPMIDTAGKYGAGLALEVIGAGLKTLDADKDSIVISNKLGWYRVPLQGAEPTFEPGAWANLKFDAEQRISYSGILECWEQGCQLLGGYYKPQVVSVHDPDEYLMAATCEADRAKRVDDILGGSVMPPLQGAIVDLGTIFSMSAVRFSFFLPAICFVAIIIYGYRTVKIHSNI